MSRTALGALAAAVALVIAPAAARAETSAYSWGANYDGALGLGVESGAFTEFFDVPQAIGGLSEVTQIAAGENHGLAVLASGNVEAWGADGDGQLGNGETKMSDVPQPVTGLSEARAVAAGAFFSLALNRDGTVQAWGGNGEGQLGRGSSSGPETCGAGSSPCSKSPVAVPGLTGVRAIAANGNHALALLEDGTVMAWGANVYGQDGDGTKTEKDAPVPVEGITEAVAVAAGMQFSLALLRNGEVRTWGRNNFGQLGNGTTTDSDVPVTVTGLAGVGSIAAGRYHSLALLEDGTVRAWGEDVWGELGNGREGSGEMSSAPVQVSGLSGVTAVAAGGQHSFALLTGGVPEAWGGDEYGELGDGRFGSGVRSDVPVALSCSLKGLEGIASGYTDGFAWGAPQELCPVVASVTPSSGPAGTEVTIEGTGLGSASEVLFGSQPATSMTAESPTQVRATAPAGSETVDVRVVTAKGESPASKADWFTYPGRPTVTQLEPRNGWTGARVEIHGTDFADASAVDFGATPATEYEIEGPHLIVATAPPGEGAVDVTVTNPFGTSETGHQDLFVYEETPEYGRCKGGGGNFSTKGCTVEGEVRLLYEWYPAFGTKPLEKTGFTLSAAGVTIESRSRTRIGCSALHGSGRFVSDKGTTYSGLVLTGCASPTLGSCKSAGAATGEIDTDALAGLLGFAKAKGKSFSAVQFSPASGTKLAEFECGAHAVALSASFVVPIGKEDVTTTTMSLKAKQKKGVQAVAAIEGSAEAPMQLTVDGGTSSQAGIKASLSQTNEEGVEVNGYA